MARGIELKKQTTTKGFAILSTAGITNKILALVYVPIQLHILKDVGNGIAGAGFNIYTFIFYLSNAGLLNVISKLVSEQIALNNYKNSQKIFKVAGLTLAVSGMVFSILMALGARLIAEFINVPKAYLTILAIAPALFFASISSAFKGYFQGFSNMIPTAVSQIVEQVVNSTLTIVFMVLLIKYGTIMAAAGTSLATSFGAFAAAAYLCIVFLKNRKNMKMPEPIDGKTVIYSTRYILKTLLVFCIPAVFNSIVNNISGILDLKIGMGRLIASGFDANSATALYGIYSNKYGRILNIPLVFSATLPVTLVPAISSAIALADRELLKRKISEAYRIIFIILIPSAVGLAILAKPIFTLVFFSTVLNRGYDFLMLGSFSIVLYAIIGTQSAVLMAGGKPYTAPVNLAVGTVIKIILNYILISIPALNLKGAIISTLISLSLVCVLNHYMTKRLLDISLNPLKSAIKPIVASLLMAMSVYGLFAFFSSISINFIGNALLRNDLCTVAAIVPGAVLYLILMIKFKAINSTDIDKLPAGKKLNHILVKAHLLNKL
jgi:Uncharacterized membrane protein, putative virulence factor